MGQTASTNDGTNELLKQHGNNSQQEIDQILKHHKEL